MKKKVFLTSTQFVELFKLWKSGKKIKALSKQFGQKGPAISRNLHKIEHSLNGGRLPVTKGSLQLRMAISVLKTERSGVHSKQVLNYQPQKSVIGQFGLVSDPESEAREKLANDLVKVIDAYVDTR